MVTHLPLITRPMAELCADGRTVFLPGGAMAVVTDEIPTADDPFLQWAAAAARLSGPLATPLFPQEDSELLRRMLARQSAEDLDLTPVHWPESAGPVNLPALAKWADDLRLPAQVLRTQLHGDGTTDEPVPYGPHRVVDLDAEGRITAPGTGVTVRLAPMSHREPSPWADVPAEALEMLSGKPYLSGRIVFSADGVEVGLPAALTNHRYRAALRAHGLRFGGSGDDALAATGAERVDEPTGYVDLAYRMDQAGAGAHAVVVVDGPDGESIHLAVNDEARSLSLLGPDGSVLLPATESGRIRLARYPGEPMSVEERLIQIAAASTGSSAAVSIGPSWAETTRNEVTPYTWQAADGTGRVLEIIGPAAAVSTPHLGVLAEAAEYLDQPIIVLATERPGRKPSPEQVSLLNRRLFVHLGQSVLAGGHDPVPVVYTRASASPELTRLLDEYGAPLVYEAPGLSASGGGMPMLNLGSAWTVRRPGGNPAGDGRAAPPVEDALSVDLIEAATGLRRAPAFTPPTVPVVSFLSASLTDPQAIVSGLDRAGPALPDQHSQLRDAVNRVPSLAGYHAVLSLTKPLLLDGPARPGGAAGTRGAAGAGGAAGAAGSAAQLGAMAPMLADLAGVSFDDRASHAILGAIGDLIEGNRSAEEVTTAIWEFKDDLPSTGGVRPNWIRKINALVPLVSEGHREPLAQIQTAIMTCPDPDR
ncbi:hypothetical protein [Verrucosispora sp. TAA-831]|uniref:hypothetical protein n=1 Tax=Verrucosispora sp. TAA-831 TaxID=3422227 RepID=UPI003D6FEAB7